MIYEWDDEKNQINVTKHGISFDIIDGFDWNLATIIQDNRQNYFETRLQAIGLIHNRLYVVIYTLRSNNRRIISIRKANERERKLYHAI